MHLNREDKKKIKIALLIVTCSLIIYTLLQNIHAVADVISVILGILSPFIVGLAMAFIVNMPMSLIENKVLSHLPLSKKIRRILALIISYIFVMVVIGVLLFTIIPQVFHSIQSILGNIPSLLNEIENFILNLDWNHPVLDEIAQSINDLSNTSLMEYFQNWITPESTQYINQLLDTLLGAISSVFSGFISLFLSLIFSIYMLNSKERLSRQGKELLYSMVHEKNADKIMYVGYTAYDNFFNFFTGQFVEAIALGLMTFIGMSLLNMPYALVISVIIGFGALIPMVGAILAGVIGFLILITVSPIDAIGFAVYIIVLQQFDGNLVYPKIVGRSIGLPAIWVLFAVTVGGALFGILGMLIFVPIASTIYDLLSDYKNRKLSEKKINVALK